MFSRLAASMAIVVTLAGFWTPTAQAGSGAITKPACCRSSHCEPQFSRPSCCKAAPEKETPAPSSTFKVSTENLATLGGLIIVITPLKASWTTVSFEAAQSFDSTPLFDLKSSFLI